MNGFIAGLDYVIISIIALFLGSFNIDIAFFIIDGSLIMFYISGFEDIMFLIEDMSILPMPPP
jgi:hypothetical protein